MRIPTIQGIIRRRILLNYRVDPELIAGLLPPPFSPKVHRGHAVAGICLIRLEEIRPLGFPAGLGVSSENSAHRIAVEWENEDGTTSEGVFVPRRDTNARFNVLTGGRIFPGVHSLARFEVEEHADEVSVRITEPEGAKLLVELTGKSAETLPADSIFPSLAESSAFFEGGCLGYSTRPESEELDGLELRIHRWEVAPLAIRRIRSSYFDDRNIFPEGTIQLDHALLMRDTDHEWHSLSRMTSKGIV